MSLSSLLKLLMFFFKGDEALIRRGVGLFEGRWCGRAQPVPGLQIVERGRKIDEEKKHFSPRFPAYE